MELTAGQLPGRAAEWCQNVKRFVDTAIVQTWISQVSTVFSLMWRSYSFVIRFAVVVVAAVVVVGVDAEETNVRSS